MAQTPEKMGFGSAEVKRAKDFGSDEKKRKDESRASPGKASAATPGEPANKLAKMVKKACQKFKLLYSYRKIKSGQKFKRAGIAQPKRGNVVKAISRDNLTRLIAQLKARVGEKRKFGLLPEEVDLFAALLDLPYGLQHATNHYYRVLRDRSLRSYDEIRRTTPDYTSPFSTPGNISKLGNGDFVFFRLFVEGVNGEDTRYGETKLLANMRILRKCGWVSLHDQLIPFPRPNARTLYAGSSVLRTAAVFDSQGRSVKGLYDSIRYTYRTGKLTNKKTKETQVSFKASTTKTRQVKFTSEMFYGEDILLGIALSVILELWQLKECGYREVFLKQFAAANKANKVLLLGNLIRGFFRIEGKYPVEMRFKPNPDGSLKFQPFAGTDSFSSSAKERDDCVQVLNPDGDGRYQKDGSVNPDKMRIGALKEEIERLRHSVRFNEDANVTYKRKKFQLELYSRVSKEEVEIVNIEIMGDRCSELFNQQVISYEDLRKLSIEQLQIISLDPFYWLLRDGVIKLEQIVQSPVRKLKIVSELFSELLELERVTFDELIACSEKQLRILGKHDLAIAMDEREFSFQDLVALCDKPKHLEYVTCEDLYELVLGEAPNVDPVLIDYAEKFGVDLEEVIGELCESDAETFKLNLGLYDEDPNEGAPDDYDPEQDEYDPEQDEYEPDPDDYGPEPDKGRDSESGKEGDSEQPDTYESGEHDEHEEKVKKDSKGAAGSAAAGSAKTSNKTENDSPVKALVPAFKALTMSASPGETQKSRPTGSHAARR